MSDSALSVRYRKFRYQAQSDIADHGYRTKCPPMGTYTINYSEFLLLHPPPLKKELQKCGANLVELALYRSCPYLYSIEL